MPFDDDPTRPSSDRGEPDQTETLIASEAGPLPDLGPKFEVLQRLGQGGMGTVYKVRHLALDHVRAVKVLAQDADENAVARFKREAVIQTELAHPHIATVFDLEGLPNGLGIVMECLEGQDLSAYIKQHGSMPMAEIVERFRGVADALDRMHEADVIHRDLKPANLFMCEDGTLKILDFGISRLVSDDSGPTQTGAILGTPSFMSPEQLEGEGVGPRADIYSLGAVLYNLLTGTPHVSGASNAEIAAAILFRKAPRVDDISPGQPPHVVDAIARALQRDPERRFHSAGDLIRSLEDPSYRAQASSSLLRMLKPKRKEPNVKALWFVVVMAAMVATAIYISGQRNPAGDDPAGGEATPPAVMAPQPVRGGTLEVALPVKIPSLDPAHPWTSEYRHLNYLLYDTITELDWTGEVLPSLATSWEVTEDHLHYTLHLRDDAVFHDDPCFPDGKGRPMVAEDVRRSLQRIFLMAARDERNGWRTLPPIVGTDAVLAGESEHLAGLRAVGQTVEVSFTRAAPAFLECAAWPGWSIVPTEALDTYGEEDLGFRVVGTGPYRLEGNSTSSNLALVPHTAAWQRDDRGAELPYLDRMEVRTYRGALTALTALQEGKAHLALHIGTEEIDNIAAIDGATATPKAGWEEYRVIGQLDEARRNVMTLLVDRRGGHPAASQAIVRRAVGVAIRRADLEDDRRRAVAGPLGPGLLGYQHADTHDGDGEAAQALLASAGFSAESPLPPMGLCGVEGHRNELESIQRRLAEAGIETELSLVEHARWMSYIIEGGCDLTTAEYVETVIDDDPTAFMLGLCDHAGLALRYPEAGPLMDEIHEAEQDRRAVILDSLSRLLLDDASILFLTERRPGLPLYSTVAGPAVRGATHPRTGLMNPRRQRLRQMWLEQETHGATP